MVLEKTLESPLDCREIQPVHRKGDQSWIFIGRPDAEAETPILWPADTKNWLTGKHPYAGKDWRQEKGMTENEMVGWTRWLTRWTWVWESSGSWWWTRKPGVLWFMGLQIVGHDWATELNWTEALSLVLGQCFLLGWLFIVFLSIGIWWYSSASAEVFSFQDIKQTQDSSQVVHIFYMGNILLGLLLVTAATS